jgi:hypothetical protein
MAGFKLTAFGGISPRVAPTLLQDNEATRAVNSKLYSGALRPWSRPYQLTPRVYVGANTKTIYKAIKANGDNQWFAWNNEIDIVKGPLTDNQAFRLYYTGDGAPKKTNSTLAGASSGGTPAAYLELGVPAPLAAPTVTRVGAGTDFPETRVYVVTAISTFGGIKEESAPSVASAEVVVYSGDSVTVGNLSAPGIPTGQYNITHRRIYRSVTGTAATALQFVAEVAVGTNTYSDTKSSAELGETLKTDGWVPPPAGLKGLIELPNGILAGFVGREVFFSEPGFPHAWPVAYSISVEHDIVGLGVFGQSVAVMTKGAPYLLSGVSSVSMSAEKIALVEPCVSKRSIVSDSNGVTYASPNGLVELGPGGPQIITRNVMTHEEFGQFSPVSALAASTQSRYFMFFESGTYDFSKGCLIFDRHLPATPLTTSTLIANAAWTDPQDSKMYVVDHGEILEWEGDQVNAIPFEWKSKEFITPDHINLGAVEILADFGNIGLAEDLQAEVAQISQNNQVIFNAGGDFLGEFNDTTLNTYELNGSVLSSIPQQAEDRFVVFILYVDGEEKYRTQVTRRGIYRLPAGYKSDRFQFGLSGNVELRHVKVAETVLGLKQL